MSYFNRALGDQAKIVEMAEKIPEEVTMVVGTGVSGTIGASIVSYATDRKLSIVRKEDDHSNHSGATVEGCEYDDFDGYWAFVDDFICSGGTRRRVIDEMSKRHPGAVYAGDLLYQSCGWDTNYKEHLDARESLPVSGFPLKFC